MEKFAGFRPPGSNDLRSAHGWRSPKKWLAVAVAIALLAVAALAVAAPALSAIARSKIQAALQDRFDSDLQIQNLKVSVFPSVSVSGESAVFRRKGHSDQPPLIEIARFTAQGSFLGLLARHVSLARLEGLRIHIPPKDANRSKEVAMKEELGADAVLDTVQGDFRKLNHVDSFPYVIVVEPNNKVIAVGQDGYNFMNKIINNK